MKIFRIMIVCCLVLALTVPLSAQNDKLKKEAYNWIEKNKDELSETSKNIWDYAEISLTEYKSAEELASLAEKYGFTVERGVADMPTAFVASYGSGHPIIGIVGEYDALPGLSQEAVNSQKTAIVEGEPGQGCGHSVFGVASLAAAISIKEVMVKNNISGTIKFFGSPAEETVIGKVYMVKAGLFDDLDICLDWHPSSRNSVGLSTSNALNNFEIEFRGKTAHSAGGPWNGRSALDAVELTNIGVNFLREHVRPTVRIHYVIPNGGMAPNVVPDYAKAWYYVRGKDRAEVEEVYARVLKIAEGAALMTETTLETYLITGVYNYLKNRAVGKVLHDNLTTVGAPDFTEEEHMFAKEVQKTFGVEEKGLHTEINEFKEPEGFSGSGSTDVADISWKVPTAALSVATHPLGVPGHSWGVVTCVGSSIGYKGLRTAAKTLAGAGIDYLMNPELIKTAKAEFDKATEGFTYISSVPQDQKPRLPKIKNK